MLQKGKKMGTFLFPSFNSEDEQLAPLLERGLPVSFDLATGMAEHARSVPVLMLAHPC